MPEAMQRRRLDPDEYSLGAALGACGSRKGTNGVSTNGVT